MTDPLVWLVGGIIAVPFSLLGLLLVAVGAYSFIQRLYLIALGERTVGIVVALVGGKEPQQLDDGGVGFPTLAPYLRLTFTDTVGQSRKVTSDMGVSRLQQHIRLCCWTKDVIRRYGLDWEKLMELLNSCSRRVCESTAWGIEDFVAAPIGCHLCQAVVGCRNAGYCESNGRMNIQGGRCKVKTSCN